MSPAPAPGSGDPLARLEAVLRDLEGYVQRRAEELAAPLIAAAEKRAAEMTGEARADVQRQEDLVRELRRILDAKDRQVARWREIAEGKAADFIVRLGEMRPGDRFLDSGCLYELLRVDTYDDHLGFSVRDEDGKQWSLGGQPSSLTAVRRSAVKSSSDGDER